jgi:hypothetical protein
MAHTKEIDGSNTGARTMRHAQNYPNDDGRRVGEGEELKQFFREDGKFQILNESYYGVAF